MSNDFDKWNHFKKILGALIKSGDQEPEQKKLKELKNICKRKEVLICDVFFLLMKYLKSDHCQKRISTMQIIHQLFMRSHEFRELTLEQLKDIVSLTLALEAGEELPPPNKFHNNLKACFIKSIDTWNDQFGAHYKKLRVSHTFLQTKKHVNFKRLIAQTDFEYREEQKRLEHEKNIREFKADRALAAYEEKLDTFTECIDEANTCFDLLIPEGVPVNDNSLTNCEITPDLNTPNSCTNSELKSHGIVDSRYELSVTVYLSKKVCITETSDNTSIIQNIDDNFHQITTSFVPQINAWIESLIKNNVEQSLVLPLIKMKEKLDTIAKKYNDLEFVRSSKRKRRIVQKEIDDDDEDDFEEVNENHVLNSLKEEERLNLLIKTSKVGTVHKTSNNTIDKEEPGPSGLTIDQVPGSDKMKQVLKSETEIEEEDLELHKAALIKFESLHRFWSTKEFDAEDLNIDTVRVLNPNYCNVPGKFEPITWTCRAPLSSNKLCPRMDRFKCPLHGKIIPRDADGRPSSKNELFESKDILMAAQNNETWKDVEKEVERLTGEKLNYSKIKKKKEKKKKTPSNLVAVNKPVATPRTRIEKKILNRDAVKRANTRADRADSARNTDRFGQKFNYALK